MTRRNKPEVTRKASKKYRETMKDKGMVAIHVYVPAEIREEILQYIRKKRDAHLR